MRRSTCGPGASWCGRTDALFGAEGTHVLHATRDPDAGGEQGLVVLDVDSDADLTGCPDCRVAAVGHGRHVQVLHDAPCFGAPVRVRWRKRIWRCPEPSFLLERGQEARRDLDRHQEARV